MTGEVQLPGMIDPDAPYVEFRATGCRECGEASPVVLATNPEWHEWMTRHGEATGHTKIHEYKISRSAGVQTTIGALRSSRRRTLGKGSITAERKRPTD